MKIHFSILDRKTSWTEYPSGLQSLGSQRVECDWSTEHTHMWYIIYYIFSILWLLLVYVFCFVNLWSILVLWYTLKFFNSFKIYFKIKLDKFYLVTLNILNSLALLFLVELTFSASFQKLREFWLKLH